MTIPDNKTPKPEDDAFEKASETVDEILDDSFDEGEASHSNDDMSDLDMDAAGDSDVETGDIEYADAEILPPIKAEPKKGLGFKSLLTATVFAGLLGAGGGFGLSYYLLPKLTPAPDTQALETRITTLSQENQDVSSKLERLQTSVRDSSRQAQAAGLTDLGEITPRLEALEKTLSDTPPNSDVSERVLALERNIQALTAFEGTEGEAVPVEIARRLEALEQGDASARAGALNADPATFMYGDRLLRDILQEILENQITLQGDLETTTQALSASGNEGANNGGRDAGASEAGASETGPAESGGAETDASKAISKASSASLKDTPETITGENSQSSASETSTEETFDTKASDSDIANENTSDTDTSDTGTSGENSASTWPKDKPTSETSSKSVIGAMSSGGIMSSDVIAQTTPSSTTKTASPTSDMKALGAKPSVTNTSEIEKTEVQPIETQRTVATRSVIALPPFPEAELREALRENELSGKNWFARVIGRNLSVKKTGERDAVDEIVDLVARGNISEALDKMETLPSSVRSNARDWMKAARQAR